MAIKSRRTMHEQNMEKQMSGCMSGFFNLFDRNHRHYPKRLPPPVVDYSLEIVSSTESPVLSRNFGMLKQQPQEIRKQVPDEETTVAIPSPKCSTSVAESESTFDFKEVAKSTWKFTREAPRLSLDSRAITDAKGGLRPREIRINTSSRSGNFADDDERRSPSVIARLMGLEPLPSSTGSEYEPVTKVELRRSASESRSRDYGFVDGPSILSPIGKNKSESIGERKLGYSAVNFDRRQNRQHSYKNNAVKNNKNNTKMSNQNQNQNRSNCQRRLMLERRGYYDATDFFPPDVSTKQQPNPVTIYGEIERRLRMRGIDEPSKDLDSLKHILEAVQLKGLLHSKTRQNVLYDRRFFSDEESPIVLMKPVRQTSPTPVNRRRNNNVSSGKVSVSPRRERTTRSAVRSPVRGENRSSSPTVRRIDGPVSVEMQRRGLNSPVRSPRLASRSDQTVSRSPRRRRPTVEINQRENVSTVSESSFSTCSHTDSERWRVEEYKDGKNLLERCDKLLSSIAEITASSSSNSNSSELQQPSPVSVLDSSFYKEDESSPSPVKKRIIDFKDQAAIEFEEDLWSPSSSTRILKLDNDIDLSDDFKFNYVSEVLRASNYFPNDDDNSLFLLVEKQIAIRGISRDNSKVSILQRKLIFDTVTEILDRHSRIPPWKSVSRSMLEQIWSDFQKIRDQGPSKVKDDLLEVVNGVIQKDLGLDSNTEWCHCPSMEISEAVLDVERLIFKDLIGETIRDLAAFDRRSAGVETFRRKLVF